jgi:hypothetical protein
MSFGRNAKPVPVPLCIIAYFVSMPALFLAQQGASATHFGPSALHTSSTIGSVSSGRAAQAGGSSSWTAGKGSFRSSVQPGGVWHEGSTLGTAPRYGGSSPLARRPAEAGFASSGNLGSGSLSPRPTGLRGGAPSGAAHFSGSSSGQRFGGSTFGRSSASKSFRSQSRGTGTSSSQPSSGLRTGVAQTSSRQGMPDGSLQRGRPNTGLTKSGPGALP